LLSVGCVTALGWTVVSTVTRAKCFGSATTARCAAARQGTHVARQASTGPRFCELFACSAPEPSKREDLRRPETQGIAPFSALFTGDYLAALLSNFGETDF
jgi:hypothetical protein